MVKWTAIVKVFQAALIVALASVAFATVSDAACRGTAAAVKHGGYCPAGTCAESGGAWACNMKNCAAKNCRK
jgi:hypothetical protein